MFSCISLLVYFWSIKCVIWIYFNLFVQITEVLGNNYVLYFNVISQLIFNCAKESFGCVHLRIFGTVSPNFIRINRWIFSKLHPKWKSASRFFILKAAKSSSLFACISREILHFIVKIYVLRILERYETLPDVMLYPLDSADRGSPWSSSSLCRREGERSQG